VCGLDERNGDRLFIGGRAHARGLELVQIHRAEPVHCGFLGTKLFGDAKFDAAAVQLNLSTVLLTRVRR
jgi:hypothetical protein